MSIFYNMQRPSTHIYTLPYTTLFRSGPRADPWVGSLRIAAPDCGLTAIGPDAIEKRTEIVLDRKSTRLNSSHVAISYAVFCLKKKSAVLAHHIGLGGAAIDALNQKTR